MKSILPFFVAFLIAVNLHYAESIKYTIEQIKTALQPVKEICIEKVKIDPKMVDEANKGNFANDRKLQCYYKCLMLMAKAMKNDVIMVDQFAKAAQTMLVDELVNPVLKAMAHCAPIISEPLEGCELAFALAKCYYEYDPKLMFLP